MRRAYPFALHRVLAHYDAQCKEGSGSGVAVATGWQAAGHILETAK